MLCRPAKQCEFLLVCLVLFTAVAWAQPQLSYQRVSYTIDTFAGLPVVGDGRPAVQAQLDSPTDVAVDGSGNLYIADRGHHRIRKIDSTGKISTVAGTGEDSFGGDGSPAVHGQLSSPFGVAVDGSGNLYIADRDNHRIRKVDSAGTITTVAGTGEHGFSGDGGAAVEAQLASPTGVTVDGSGNLYIADRDNHRIRKIDSTGTITTVTGTGEDSFGGDEGPAVRGHLSSPFGVGVDGSGNLYIADWGNHRIRKIDSTGTITTVAGTGEYARVGESHGDGGPAVEAQLNSPTGVAVDGAGNVYIVDAGLDIIRKVDSTGTITRIAGRGRRRWVPPGFGGDGGPAVQAQLNSPTGVAVDGSGNLYIADRGNHRIRRVDSNGLITTTAGTGEYAFSGDGGPASQAQLSDPFAVAVDGAGNVYIADASNGRVRKVDSTGTITTIAGTGEYGFGGDGGPAVEAQFRIPIGVLVDGSGNLYIADRDNQRIRKVDSTGTITTIAGTGEYGFDGDDGPAVQAQLASPAGMAVDGSGNLYIADSNNHAIRKIDSAGTITTVAGTGEHGFSGDGGPAVEAQLFLPVGVAVDGSGNLYIADHANRRIRKVDSTGTITTVSAKESDPGFGDGGPPLQHLVFYPGDVAVDGVDNLYIVEYGKHRIRKVDSAGTITTIAGTEEAGFGGDGGPALQARFNYPTGMAVGGRGNVYIADPENGRIRILRPRYRLDFAHFANGASVTSDLVLVNVAPHPIRPAFYFYDKDGSLIAAQSVIEVTGDLEVAEDEALTVRTEVEPLGELTISTHGQGEVVRGSVAVVANGPIGGVLRFDLPGVGVAGVGAGQPVRDAIFPARRQASGISTAAAIRILDDDRHAISCRLIKEGAVLEEVKLDLGGDRQEAQFIEEMFTATDTSDFVGLVRCTVSSSEVFVGVAVELDAGNGIFTTLPVVPVPVNQPGDGNKEVALEFAHFANGSSITSDLVLVNVAPHPIRPALYFYDRDGDRIAAQSVVEVQGELEVAEDGALTVQSELEPLQKLTISTNGQGEVVAGSVTVVADGPLGGVLRFDLPGVGVAGVGAGQPVRDAIFPARRQAGGISTAAAIRNPGEEELVVSCRLMQGGAVLEERDIDLKAKGQDGRFIHEVFTRTDTTDFVGLVRCTAEGEFTGVAVELDAGNRIFTTLPLVPVTWMTAQE